MSLRRANSADGYVEWVRQAVFEVGELRECPEHKQEDLSGLPTFLAPLEEGSIKALYQSMRDGTYCFGREDLPCMDLAGRYAHEIPFRTLLKQINQTHCRGVVVEGEDP